MYLATKMAGMIPKSTTLKIMKRRSGTLIMELIWRMTDMFGDLTVLCSIIITILTISVRGIHLHFTDITVQLIMGTVILPFNFTVHISA